MNTTIPAFHVIGIQMRTTNEHEKAAADIPILWQRFMSEQIASKISNKIEDNIYCIYTEYEGDYTKPYTVFLGCKVKDLSDIPVGMRGMEFSKGNYRPFVAKGDIIKGIIAEKWYEIWNTEIDRAYTQDFEVYGAKAQNPQDAEVNIFIAIK